MATTTIAATDFELDTYSSQPVGVETQIAGSSKSRAEDAAEASRIVDAGVPEGGYGA